MNTLADVGEPHIYISQTLFFAFFFDKYFHTSIFPQASETFAALQSARFWPTLILYLHDFKKKQTSD